MPIRWLAVCLEFRKPDQGRLRFGTVRDPSLPLYGLSPMPLVYTSTPTTIVPNADEPTIRDYFARVAHAHGRTIEE